MKEDQSTAFRKVNVDAALAARVLHEIEADDKPTNLEDLCLRLKLRQEIVKTALHWLIDSGFLKRSMRLKGFKFYPRKKPVQTPLFEETTP